MCSVHRLQGQYVRSMELLEREPAVLKVRRGCGPIPYFADPIHGFVEWGTQSLTCAVSMVCYRLMSALWSTRAQHMFTRLPAAAEAQEPSRAG